MNAAVAIATMRALARQIPVTEEVIRSGLAGVQWPGRLQLVTRSSGQMILLDGAHNVAGAEALASALKQHFPSAKLTLLFGILRDKDWSAMCGILAPMAGHILVLPGPSEPSAAPPELAGGCRRANPTAEGQEYPSP